MHFSQLTSSIAVELLIYSSLKPAWKIIYVNTRSTILSRPRAKSSWECCPASVRFLRLFGDAHFESRKVPNAPRKGDVSQVQVLSIGKWGRRFENPCWAAIIDKQLKFYFGNGKELLAPRGAGIPPYPFYRNNKFALFYNPHNTTPFRVV